jgi:hypothetical protein
MAIQLTTEPAITGLEAATMPNSGVPQGCLRLKLRMPQRLDVITTVTHGFIKQPDPPKALLLLLLLLLLLFGEACFGPFSP